MTARHSASALIQLSAQMAVDRAQGVLMQSRRLDPPGALNLLQGRADQAGLPLAEGARWLLTTGTLP